jgi:adenine deaminase
VNHTTSNPTKTLTRGHNHDRDKVITADQQENIIALLSRHERDENLAIGLVAQIAGKKAYRKMNSGRFGSTRKPEPMRGIERA